ncbi:hypothetical protein K2X05_14790 [bacterium]|nr:hypothetical protein [bacterium]
MINFLKNRSFLIYTIALITPLISWLVLYSLAQNTTNSFDPNPWVQGFVATPGQVIEPQLASTSAVILPAASHSIIKKDVFNPHALPQQLASLDTHWVHVVSERGNLFVKTKETLTPIEDFAPSNDNLIFLVEAQGPTAAGQLFTFLKDHKLIGRCLILAVSDGFLKDVRYYNSEVALGAGQAYLVRFRALQTLMLENFLLINMSGLWLRPEIFKDSTQKLTDTFVRLHVPVFIGPVSRSQIPTLPKNANYLVVD